MLVLVEGFAIISPCVPQWATSRYASILERIKSDGKPCTADPMMKGTPYEGLPVLSAAAPFKAGGRDLWLVLSCWKTSRSATTLDLHFLCGPSEAYAGRAGAEGAHGRARAVEREGNGPVAE